MATYALVVGGVQAQTPIGFVSQVSDSTNRETVPFIAVRSLETDGKGLRHYGRARGPPSAGLCGVDLDARTKRQIVELREQRLDELLGRFLSAGHVIVYVHGYNVGFDESCVDAAMLQQRLGHEHELLLFSWPAEAKMLGYLRDIGDLAWSVAPLRDLLVTLTERIGPLNVDLIGHSLGAKAVVDAAVAFGTIPHAGQLGRLVLIAPDIDSDVFVRDFADVSSVAAAVTIYVSPKDRALKASRNLRDEPRLGESPVGLLALEGVVDVVQVTQGFPIRQSGHTYHLHSSAVAEDLRAVLSGPPHIAGWRMVDADPDESFAEPWSRPERPG